MKRIKKIIFPLLMLAMIAPATSVYSKDDGKKGKMEKPVNAAIIYAGVVEDAANATNKLGGVKIYGIKSSKDKKPILLATTDKSGRFEIKLSASQKDLYKILLFDPKNIKGYKNTKQIRISASNDYSKLKVKLFK